MDLDAMSFHIGVKITEDDFKEFSDKIITLPDSKLFIPSFITFQQKTLSNKNPAHKNIIIELEKYNINESLDISHIESPSEAPPKPLQRDISNSKGNSKGIGISELSVFHIEHWLTEKRVAGKYLMIDEHRLLEKFKDYCISNGKTYKDYVAAFRNSFEWSNAPTIETKHVSKQKERLYNEATTLLDDIRAGRA